MDMQRPERIETVVIGGGQAGLSVGYHLRQLGLPFEILDADARIGDSWRNRWDSLRLFTPARYDGLDGMPFPAPPHSFPTKDEMADYLESYARRFRLPVRNGTRVSSLTADNGHFLIRTAHGTFQADNVVVAMASWQQPRVPELGGELDPAILQLHSSEYRAPVQLSEGSVLVVGAGNSGAEIAIEVAREHPTMLAGPDTGHIPFRVEGMVGRVLVPVVLRLLFHRILTTSTPMGRRARPKMIRRGERLIRTKPEDLAAAGVRRLPRLVGVRGGSPLLEDGQVVDVANVIWCTGFGPGFSWIDLPAVVEGQPDHERGVVPGQPGLFFVGLKFLHAVSSAQIHGVGRDAARIARAIEARRRGIETVGSSMARPGVAS